MKPTALIANFSFQTAALHVAFKQSVWRHGRVPMPTMAALAKPAAWGSYAIGDLPEPRLRQQHCFRRAAFAHLASLWLDEHTDNYAAIAEALVTGIDHKNSSIAAAALSGVCLASADRTEQPLRHLVSQHDRMGAGFLQSAIARKAPLHANMESQRELTATVLQAMIIEYDRLRASRPRPALPQPGRAAASQPRLL